MVPQNLHSLSFKGFRFALSSFRRVFYLFSSSCPQFEMLLNVFIKVVFCVYSCLHRAAYAFINVTYFFVVVRCFKKKLCRSRSTAGLLPVKAAGSRHEAILFTLAEGSRLFRLTFETTDVPTATKEKTKKYRRSVKEDDFCTGFFCWSFYVFEKCSFVVIYVLTLCVKCKSL